MFLATEPPEAQISSAPKAGHVAQAKARKLKVFQTQIGFYDTVVAAPSRPAALRAWGVHQDLFAAGQARVMTDDAATAAALRHPGTPLRRPVGAEGPFELEAATLPSMPDVPKPRAKPAKRAATPGTKPPPDRTKLTAAEAVLRDLDQQRLREEGELQREQDALDRRTEAAQQAYVAARKRASAAVASARQAYRKAGEGEGS
jgi:hypothetical protein